MEDPTQVDCLPCCVPGCEDTLARRIRFPRPDLFAEIFTKWLDKIGNETLKSLEPSVVHENYFVCAEHFAEDCYIDSTKFLLGLNAIPTKFPTDICRGCLKNKTVVAISEATFDSCPLSKIFQDCTSLKVTVDDGRPDNLCQTCLYDLLAAWEFINKCKANDLMFPQVKVQEDVGTQTFPDINEVQLEVNKLYRRPAKDIDNSPKESVCPYCQHIIPFLANHIQSFHPEAQDACLVCCLQFDHSEDFFEHKELVHDRPFCCELCEQVLLGVDGLKNHQEVDCAEGSHICPLCPNKFYKQSALTQHLVWHENVDWDNTFMCVFCGKNFTTEEELKSHKETEHKITPLPPQSKKINIISHYKMSPVGVIEVEKANTDFKLNNNEEKTAKKQEIFENGYNTPSQSSRTSSEEPVEDSPVETYIPESSPEEVTILTEYEEEDEDSDQIEYLEEECLEEEYLEEEYLEEEYLEEQYLSEPFTQNGDDVLSSTSSEDWPEKEFIEEYSDVESDSYDDSSTEDEMETTITLFKCNFCVETFSSKDAMIEHTEEAHAEPKILEPCCVPGCKNKTSERLKFPFRNKALCREWIRRTKNPKLQNLSLREVYLKHVICTCHFSPKMFRKGQLCDGALPQLKRTGKKRKR